MSAYSVNEKAASRVLDLAANAATLRLRMQRLANGVQVIDAGIDCRGGVEVGRLIGEICMGGLGHVGVSACGPAEDWVVNLQVHSDDPVNACLGCQYAGWSLTHGAGKAAFHALGSGPGRVLARKEALYSELDISDACDRATLVLEVDQVPPLELTTKIAADCGVTAENLTLILTPTSSLAGTTQVVARVLEVAMHKAHELHFPLADIVDGAGVAPLPPPAPDFLNAMGRTNDAILFGGQVHLYVRGTDHAARDLAETLPSSASRDYGRPFAQIFESYDYDFFKIDPMLFSPARVTVTALQSGKTYRAGRIDRDSLAASFGVQW